VEQWLESVEVALRNIRSQVRFFFRDDDAGWHDDRLFKLMDCFSAFAMPLDLAAIPQAFDAQSAALLRNRIEASEQRIGIHQHGFRHLNHQNEGRKCEFGSYRSYEQQKFDIWMGQCQLCDYFGYGVDQIFTPPWNRCTQDTVEVLIDLEFASISRDETAIPLNTGRLVELPVNVDWFKKKRGMRLQPIEIGKLIASAIWEKSAIGVMLHHEHMDQKERAALSELLALLDSSSNVECVSMRDLRVF